MATVGRGLSAAARKARSNATFNPLMRGLISSRRARAHGDSLAPDDQDSAVGTAGFPELTKIHFVVARGVLKSNSESTNTVL